MKTLLDLAVHNGEVTEQYSSTQDEAGEIFLHNCLDNDTAGPVDTMHIDRRAAVQIARALLQAVGRQGMANVPPVVIPAPAANVIAFRGRVG
jgi:nucleoside diphosphate kinase